MANILRRTFLIGSAAIAGGVAFGYYQLSKPFPNPLLDNLGEDEAALSHHVLIDKNGVSIIVPRAEMGQNVRTTLAALVAEELDISLEKVNVIHGPASTSYHNFGVFEEAVTVPSYDVSPAAERQRAIIVKLSKFIAPFQMTGGSSSTLDAFERFRKAGAAARIALVETAAKRLGVDPASLTTDDGAVVDSTGARIPYTDLAIDARNAKLPKDPKLKPQSEWKLLGKSLPRVDIVEKSTGAAQYAMDVRLPGMVFATIKMNPNLDAPLNSFDASKAEAMPGVKKVVQIDNGVAVIASNTWNAFKAADAVDFDWGAPAYPLSSDGHFEKIAESFDEEPDSNIREDGDVDAVFADGDVIEAEYRAPYLAHATMEPVGATALFKDGKLEIWGSSQIPDAAQGQIADALSLKEKDVIVHTLFLGGGYGRRLEQDFMVRAAQVAAEMEGVPVKVTWSREEDMTHDAYRPAAIMRMRAAVKDGKPAALEIKAAAPSILDSQFAERLGVSLPGPDSSIVQSLWDQPYGIENYRTLGYRGPKLAPVSSWRSVGASQNGFFHETAMDEVAIAAGADPVEMRLDLMIDEASRKVIEKTAEACNWGAPLPSGKARGFAFVLSFGVPVAEVIEISQTPDGIKIDKVWATADVGNALDKGSIVAQVQSGVIFGLSAAIHGEISFENGAVKQTNFHDYDGVRMYQTPEIEVHVHENQPKIRGIGEPGVPPAAPALGNAIFALTGERLRELPFGKSVKFI